MHRPTMITAEVPSTADIVGLPCGLVNARSVDVAFWDIASMPRSSATQRKRSCTGMPGHLLWSPRWYGSSTFRSGKLALVGLGPFVDGSGLSRISSASQLGRGSHVFGLFVRLSHGRWPLCLPRIGSRSKARIRDAVALVGFPDHRFDRFCITCC
jgi:hypothetical protein